jgi:hypothetical protein
MSQNPNQQQIPDQSPVFAHFSETMDIRSQHRQLTAQQMLLDPGFPETDEGLSGQLGRGPNNNNYNNSVVTDDGLSGQLGKIPVITTTSGSPASNNSNTYYPNVHSKHAYSHSGIAGASVEYIQKLQVPHNNNNNNQQLSAVHLSPALGPSHPGGGAIPFQSPCLAHLVEGNNMDHRSHHYGKTAAEMLLDPGYNLTPTSVATSAKFPGQTKSNLGDDDDDSDRDMSSGIIQHHTQQYLGNSNTQQQHHHNHPHHHHHHHEQQQQQSNGSPIKKRGSDLQ